MSLPTASMISTVMCHCCLEESEEPSLLEKVEEVVQMTGLVPSAKIKREEVRTLSLQYMLVYIRAYIRTVHLFSCLYYIVYCLMCMYCMQC